MSSDIVVWNINVLHAVTYNSCYLKALRTKPLWHWLTHPHLIHVCIKHIHWWFLMEVRLVLATLLALHTSWLMPLSEQSFKLASLFRSVLSQIGNENMFAYLPLRTTPFSSYIRKFCMYDEKVSPQFQFPLKDSRNKSAIFMDLCLKCSLWSLHSHTPKSIIETWHLNSSKQANRMLIWDGHHSMLA